MKKLLNEPSTYVVLYFVMALFTFGYAWNHVPDTEPGHFAGVEYVIRNGDGTKMLVATFSSIGWPFYWSVRLQK